MGAIGKNTVSGKALLEFVERVEVIRKEKKELSDDEAAVIADAKAAGFNRKGIRFLIKAREMKPSDFQDWQSLTEMYMHAIGMGAEPPLFRAAGLASIDVNIREQVLAAMHAFVPPHGKGSITVNFDGTRIQLERNKEGEIEAAEIEEDDDSDNGGGEPSSERRPRKPKELPAEIAALDEDGAEELGRSYARQDKPVIENPFPFGDARRARFDMGWRKETGNDGMGPDDDDD
jgi:uncharacterized protein (UPF0335 family)